MLGTILLFQHSRIVRKHVNKVIPPTVQNVLKIPRAESQLLRTSASVRDICINESYLFMKSVIMNENLGVGRQTVFGAKAEVTTDMFLKL